MFNEILTFFYFDKILYFTIDSINLILVIIIVKYYRSEYTIRIQFRLILKKL